MDRRVTMAQLRSEKFNKLNLYGTTFPYHASSPLSMQLKPIF